MFKTLKKVGKGTFANVFMVENILDKKRFAVKAFRKEKIYATENGKESLINEITLMR